MHLTNIGGDLKARIPSLSVQQEDQVRWGSFRFVLNYDSKEEAVSRNDKHDSQAVNAATSIEGKNPGETDNINVAKAQVHLKSEDQ